MAFAARVNNATLSDMNITPLVDVMLVLLIIFMVAAPMLSQSLGIAVSRGGDTRQQASPPVLRIEAGDVLSLDTVPLSGPELTRELRAMAARNPGQYLRLDIHPDADYQTVTTAMSLARNAGIENLQFGGR